MSKLKHSNTVEGTERCMDYFST